MCFGKKKTKTKSTSTIDRTTRNDPFAAAAPGLQDLAGRITAAMGQSAATPAYGGDFVATGGALQRGVIPAMQNYGTLGASLQTQAQNAANMSLGQLPQFGDSPSMAAGTASFADQPGGIEGAINSAIQPYMRQLTEQILPGLQSSAMEAGAYGNDRAMAVMPQMALRDTGRMVAEAAGGLSMQAFEQAQARNLQGYGLATNRGLGEADVLTQRLAMHPELMNSIAQAGGMQVDAAQEAANYDIAMRQAEINNNLARDEYNVNAPYRGLAPAAQLFGAFQPYGTQQVNGTERTTSTQTQSGGGLGQLLQAGLGMAGMAMGMPGGLGGLFGGAAASAANPLIMSPGNARGFGGSPLGGAFGLGG